MSDNPLALLQQGGQQLPSTLHSLMEQMSTSEMQANVGASYAVVTIKGKVFSIKYGGQTTPVTMNMNGQLYMSPFFDVVIPKAKAELSKTYYPNGYQDGDDSAPTCWSEDGITPLAPEAQRPIDLRTGAPCIDCRMCPMNEFGSKITDNGSRSKACADTRKLIVVPVDQNTGQMDGQNIKFGGAMLLRVPAASLRVFAEYDQKLQQMGIPYFGVVTRMEFDPTAAYPKFVLKATRYLSEAEAQSVVQIRDSLQVKQILESGQTGAAPRQALPAPASQNAQVAALLDSAGSVAPALGTHAQAMPGQAMPVQQPQMPPQQAAPPAQATVTPVPAAATSIPMVPASAPAAPPAQLQMTPKANGGTYEEFKAKGWPDDLLISNGYAVAVPAAPAAQQVPAVPMPPTSQPIAMPVQQPQIPQQIPMAMPPQQAAVSGVPSPAPAGTMAPQITPALMQTVDSLLGG